MSGKNISFDDKKIKKSDFYKNKKITKIYDIDVNKILVSKKELYGTKYSFKFFIGYNDNEVTKPLCIRLSKMTGYARKLDENATMSFRINNKQLLKNYNKIWEKVKKLLNIDFESKPLYGDDGKYIKTKIRMYAGSMITNFHNKDMPQEKARWKCLSIIMVDSIIKANKKYYPQTLLKECKYVQQKIKTENYFDEDLEASDSNDETESDIDNDEQFVKKYFNSNKSLIVHVNHTQLGLFLCQFV